QARRDFAALSGTQQSRELMEVFLATQHAPDANLETALNSALDAWSIGHMTYKASDTKDPPERAAVRSHRQERLAIAAIEAALLERDANRAIRYRLLSDNELRPLIRD